MKMRCLFKSVFRGDLVKVGEILDITEAEAKMDVVKHFFAKVAEDPSASASAATGAVSPVIKGKTLVAGLTRDQVVMKLNQAGVKVKGNAANAELIDLYNLTFANLAEATKK